MFWIEMTLFFEAKNGLKWPQIKVNWPIVEKKNGLIWGLILSKGAESISSFGQNGFW